MQETKLNINVMCEAYRLLYEVETKLRWIIRETCTRNYDPALQIQLNSPLVKLHTLNYYELVRIIRKIPSLKHQLTDSQLIELSDLTPIRNKICHMKDLHEEEYQHLSACYSLVKTMFRQMN